MRNRLWTTIAFTAMPAGSYEALYLQDDGTLARMPILGVMIDEEVLVLGNDDVVRTGGTRAGMAHQVEPGAADLEIAGADIGFLGVYPAGSEPLPEFVERARTRLAQSPPASDDDEL